jgi:hypothetical protein
MTTPRLSTSYDRAVELIALRKRMAGPVIWEATPEGSEIYRCDFRLLDEQDQTIPGLTVELQYVRGIVKGQSIVKLTLFSLEPPKLRAYQLCVVDAARSKHRENGLAWHGPHKHVGDKAEQVHPAWACDDHEAWFRFFLADANIQHDGDYRPPPRPMIQPSLDLGP